MKNMKVAKKLLLSFSIVAILCAIVGGVGIFGMWQINKADTELYVVQTKPMPDISKTLEYSQRLRIQLRNAVLFTGDIERLKTVETDIRDRETRFEAFAEAYSATIVNPEARTLFDEAMNLYRTVYKPAMEEILADAKNGVGQSELIAKMDEAEPSTNTMVDNFTRCMDIKVTAAEAANHGNDALYMTLLIVIIIVLVFAVVVAMVLALYISGLISKPLNRMSSLLIKMGTKGDLNLTPEEQKAIEADSKIRDEIGQCVDSCARLTYHLLEVGEVLGKVAGGDLTVDVDLLSQDDSMGLSVTKMVDNLNSMFGELKVASDQVSSGAGQVSQSAQELATGSSEQAASVEELSATITDVRSQVDENANRSEKALENCNTAGNLMDASMGSMEQMLEAMRAIDESSRNITRVIKVIDDIAFQTNILALNAAVEAARAGQHGKGFAVVADEVRNLASKSASAAKETADLIEGSSQRVSEGSKIVEQTNQSLKAVGVTTAENAALIREMAESLERQTSSVIEINQGMDQISTVVQANAATAEQSAAAAQEMSAQSVVMNGIVERFKLKRDGFASRDSFASDISGQLSPQIYSESTGFALASDKY